MVGFDQTRVDSTKNHCAFRLSSGHVRTLDFGLWTRHPPGLSEAVREMKFFWLIGHHWTPLVTIGHHWTPTVQLQRLESKGRKTTRRRRDAKPLFLAHTEYISRSPTCCVRPVDRTHNWEPFLHRFSRFHPAVPFVFKDFRVNGNRQRFQTPGGRGLLFPLGLWTDAHPAQVNWLEAHFESGRVGLEVKIKPLRVGEEGIGDL